MLAFIGNLRDTIPRIYTRLKALLLRMSEIYKKFLYKFCIIILVFGQTGKDEEFNEL